MTATSAATDIRPDIGNRVIKIGAINGAIGDSCGVKISRAAGLTSFRPALGFQIQYDSPAALPRNSLAVSCLSMKSTESAREILWETFFGSGPIQC